MLLGWILRAAADSHPRNPHETQWQSASLRAAQLFLFEGSRIISTSICESGVKFARALVSWHDVGLLVCEGNCTGMSCEILCMWSCSQKSHLDLGSQHSAIPTRRFSGLDSAATARVHSGMTASPPIF